MSKFKQMEPSVFNQSNRTKAGFLYVAPNREYKINGVYSEINKVMMKIFTSAALFSICLFTLTVWAIDGENTYILAASACPPWKSGEMQKHIEHVNSACSENVKLFTSSVKKALNVPSENIFSLVDQQATYHGLKGRLKEFADKVPDGSTIIMYFNFHGVLQEIDPQEQHEKEEVFILWTEDKPFTILSALELKQWITADELRLMIDNIKADQIVVTVDACHSGGAVSEILKQHGRDNDWQGLEAVMLSSKADQYSYLNLDGSFSLFTYYLSDAIEGGSSNFLEAFKKSSIKINEYLEDDLNQKKCKEIIWESLHKKVTCSQTPIVNDPTNLLQTIKLGSN